MGKWKNETKKRRKPLQNKKHATTHLRFGNIVLQMDREARADFTRFYHHPSPLLFGI